MAHEDRPRTWKTPIRCLQTASTLVLFLSVAGCAGIEDDALVIGTTWDYKEIKIYENFYNQWKARPPDAPRPIRWIRLSPGDAVAGAAARSPKADIILGGPASDYIQLSNQDVLIKWKVARRSELGLAVRRASHAPATLPGDSTHEPTSRRMAFDDPRRDPVSLAWARSVLNAGAWPDGYARLIREAAGPVPPGRQAGAAVSAVERGEADAAPSARLESHASIAFRPIPDAHPFLEGVGVVKGSKHQAVAEAFLKHLTTTGLIDAHADMREIRPEADAMLADLLVAALVDARPELLAAWRALAAAGRPERAEMWMTRPPPWPPASVQKILAQRYNAMEMLDTLAAQAAPEPGARAWLVRSWLSPPRLVDGRLLDELATAEDGRLAREPRFRSWLRAEWTAWARQRYRRVARLIEHGPYVDMETGQSQASAAEASP